MITRKLFLLAENMAVRHSDALVCDHPEMARYYQEKYSVKTEMITYGADPGADHGDGHGNYLNPGILDKFRLKSGEYYLLVARLEPENNIRMIIEGFLASEASVTTGALDSSGASGFSTPLVIIGKHDRGYGKTIFREFGKDQRIRFLGDLYDPARLNGLRHFSKAQFHGHSVGGTNPSLLEAMAAGASIIAHDNVYTRWVLGDNAVYFSSAGEIKDLISNANDQEFNNLIDPGVGGNPSNEANIAHNLKRIREDFQWNDIVRLYEDLFRRLVL